MKADKSLKNKKQTFSHANTENQNQTQGTFQFEDNRPASVAQREIQELADNSQQVKKTAQLQEIANQGTPLVIQKEENNTGLPDPLKTGVENLSGHSMDDVKVHYNSDKPSQLQAHAYAQGTDIHLASGQEKHLPHEAWHVAQQKQGRVKPTLQTNGVNINDNAGLEKEADVMGGKANAGNQIQKKSKKNTSNRKKGKKPSVQRNTIQRYTVSEEGYNISENEQFAIEREAYPNAIFMSEGAPLDLPGGLEWIERGKITIGDKEYTRYVADISEYEEAAGKPGTEQFCGEFARGLTGRTEPEERSTSPEGGMLYDKSTSPLAHMGWDNHYASVVKVDGGDHATFETAVGINQVWAGIYGTQKGQTFKYKTQEANIDYMVNRPDAVLGQQKRTFLEWLTRKPKKNITMPMGITEEQGVLYRRELEDWKEDGTPPASEYMKAIIEKLEAELLKLRGERTE